MILARRPGKRSVPFGPRAWGTLGRIESAVICDILSIIGRLCPVHQVYS